MSVTNTRGVRVYYHAPLDANLPDAQEVLVCSHYLRKISCKTSGHHINYDQPCVKENHPQRCGTDLRACHCPRDAQDPTKFALRTAYIAPGRAQFTQFGPIKPILERHECQKCLELKERRKADKDKKAEDDGKDGGGRGGSAGKKRRGGSDPSPAKRSKTASRGASKSGSGKLPWDPARQRRVTRSGA